MPREVIYSTKMGNLAPYHLFEVPDGTYGGGCYVYFLERDCAFRIEQVTYDLLEKALERVGASSLAEYSLEVDRRAGLPLSGVDGDRTIPIFPFEEVADKLVADGIYTRDVIAQSLADTIQLRQAGFMCPPINGLSDETKEQQLEHRFSTPRTSLALALAESCNLACTYCYCTTVRDMPNQGMMSESVAKQAIDWLFEVSGDGKELGITLFGGEPLTNKPVFRFVMEYSDALARKHGRTIGYSMTTNGTLLDEEIIDYIKKHSFGLMVSLDGPPEIHNAQCPTQGGLPSFGAATAGIKSLMRRRRRVTVRCTMTNARPNMLELIKFFHEFGFTRIILGRARNPICPTPVDCGPEDLVAYSRQEKEELLPWVLNELRQGRIPPWFPYGQLLNKPDPNPETVKPLSMFRCGACRGTMTVGADGKLYPCHRFLGMEHFVIGHISERPDPEKARNFWRAYDTAVDKACSECWARRCCDRPCPWVVSNSDGSFKSPDVEDCEAIRKGFEESVALHWHLCQEFPELVERLRTGKYEADELGVRVPVTPKRTV